MLRRPSKHYSWREVDPHGFGMPLRVRIKAVRQAQAMEKLRTAVNLERKKHGLKETGIHVLSWYRPEWYNRKIGGASRSQHIQGDACDISLAEIGRLMPWKGGRARFDQICNRLFAGGGFGQYPGGSRHVDTRGYRARWTSF